MDGLVSLSVITTKFKFDDGPYARHYPLQQNFRPSASQALHKALRRGRLAKVGGKYRLNPEWGGGPTVGVHFHFPLSKP